MADFTFLFNRKGALYPLDLYSPNSAVVTSASPHLMSKKLSEWPFNGLLDASLVNLCCKTIVNFPVAHLDKIADEIPAELFVPLFKAALYPVKDCAIDILINKWPYKSLIVSKFISNMFTSMVILYSDTEMGQRTRLGKIRFVFFLIQRFLSSLRAPTPTGPNRHRPAPDRP